MSRGEGDNSRLPKNHTRKEVIKMKVTKDMIIMDVLKINPETAQFFLDIGMHCLGCPSASMESIEQACMVHGADVDKLVDDINAFLEK